MDSSTSLREIIRYYQHKEISSLFKRFLIILEDIRDKRYHIDNGTYDNLRKRILDDGNASIRELDSFADKFDYKLKNENEN